MGLSRFIPNYYAKTVRDIDFALLHERGIRCVALDIDNTLVADGGIEIDANTIAFFREQRDKKLIDTLIIATNRSQKKIGGIAEAMHADMTFHAGGLRRKPFGSYYADLLKRTGCDANRTAMVGDKVIQDIWGGNHAGLTTVLVDPLGPSMWFERLLFRMIGVRGKHVEADA